MVTGNGNPSVLETKDEDRNLIEQILTEHGRIPFSYGDVRLDLVFDRTRDRYLLMMIGWEGYHRFNGPLIHIDLKDGKFWIEYDGTEDGVATDLLEAGVPKDRIVLAFKPLSRRKYTEFAVS